MVQAVKQLQASYNDDANKIIKQAMNKKSAIENLNFLIDLSMVTTDNKPVLEEPKSFTKADSTQCLRKQTSKTNGKNSHESQAIPQITNPDAIITYQASDIVLAVHSDAS